jgi:hypothetical protein
MAFRLADLSQGRLTMRIIDRQDQGNQGNTADLFEQSRQL